MTYLKTLSGTRGYSKKTQDVKHSCTWVVVEVLTADPQARRVHIYACIRATPSLAR